MKILNKIAAFMLLLMASSFSYAGCIADPNNPNPGPCNDVNPGGDSGNHDDRIIALLVVGAGLVWYFYEPEESLESKVLQLKGTEEEKDYSFSVRPVFNDSSQGVSASFGYKF